MTKKKEKPLKEKVNKNFTREKKENVKAIISINIFM